MSCKQLGSQNKTDEIIQMFGLFISHPTFYPEYHSRILSPPHYLVSCVFLTGVYNYQVEEDISKLKLCVNSVLQEYSLNVNIKDDYVHEL